MTRQVQQIAVAVVEDSGRFLVGVRPITASLPGYWEFPGGKAEAGERLEDAAVRECLEESGVSVAITGRYPDCLHDYPGGTVHLHFFACYPREAAQTPRPPFRWIEREELAHLRFPDGNRQILNLLLAK